LARLAVTRWREDATRERLRDFCYLRDSTAALFGPRMASDAQDDKDIRAIFTQARAEFRRRDEEIDAHTVISVSPEDDIELRRITLTNRSDSVRTIEMTTYAEVVLAPQAHDLAHPAFSNLFVQTELLRNRQAFSLHAPRAIRRERPPWMLHLMTVRGTTIGDASFETDRARFIGRDRTQCLPRALDPIALSGSEGPVLDPSVSIRCRIQLSRTSRGRGRVTGWPDARHHHGDGGKSTTTLRWQTARSSSRWTKRQILLGTHATESEAQAYSRLGRLHIYARRCDVRRRMC